MRAIQTPETSVRYRPSVPAPIRRARVRPVGRALRPVASAALRGLALLAIAGFLIFLVLPAVLMAAA